MLTGASLIAPSRSGRPDTHPGEELEQVVAPEGVVELLELVGAPQEAVTGTECVVLCVPAARALVGRPPRHALAEDLALPVGLGADRIVAAEEVEREQPAPLEFRLV